MEQNKWYEENKQSIASGNAGDDMHRFIMEDGNGANNGSSSGQQSGHGSNSIHGKNRMTIIQNSAYEVLKKSAGSEYLQKLGASFKSMLPDDFGIQSNSTVEPNTMTAQNNYEYQNVYDKQNEGKDELELDI